MNPLTDRHVESFRTEGYMIVPDFFSAEELALMRAECQAGIDAMHARMDAEGTDTIHISHRGSRYFIHHRTDESAALHGLAFGDKMAALVRRTIGPDAWFFLDQYVVKAAETGMSFAWHQDAGYITHTRVKPYLTCWIPLDDVTVENGTVFILPYSRAGGCEIVPHVAEADTNDMVGYHGDDPGIPVVVPAGTLVAFSSHLFHRSSPNATDRMRRVYLLQYTPEPIYRPDGTPQNKVTPFLKHGHRLAAR